MAKVKFAIPKGSLAEETLNILREAGYEIRGSERTYRPWINDEEIDLRIMRPQEIPTFVSEGMQDLGITGKDWIRETRSDVEILLDLEYGGVKLVLAVPKPWRDINSLSDLIEKCHRENRSLRICTEFLNLANEYIMANPVYQKYYGDLEPRTLTPWWRKGSNPMVKIFLSFGAAEAQPPDNADAILDLTETGRTLEQNNLKIVDVVLRSSAVLIASKESLKDPWKREKIYDILTLLRGVVDGRKKLHIFVNVKEENLKELMDQLPALKSPTISHLSMEGWYSINTVIDREEFLKILPTLRRLAQGLVVFEPRQVLPLDDLPRGDESG